MAQRPNDIDEARTGVGALLWEGALIVLAFLIGNTRQGEDVRAALQAESAPANGRGSKRRPQASKLSTPLRGVKCVELGAGTGLLAAALAAGGAEVVATDLDKVVPLMEENLSGVERCHVAALPWGAQFDAETDALCDRHRPSLVVVSDPVYQLPFVAPFLHTLRRMLDADPARVGVVCFEMRAPEVAGALEAGLRDAFGARLVEHRVSDAVEGYEDVDTDYVRLFVIRGTLRGG